jgi:putative flippase GtrA
LRGIPILLLPQLSEIPYAHYEFEIEMLLVAKRSGVPMVEIPIETIYLEKNKSSHFQPLLDSTRIYFVLFRYMLNSLVCAAVDYLVFFLVHLRTHNIPLSILLARIVSVWVNYILLKNWVFYSKSTMRQTFPRFVLLVAIFGAIATWLIQALTRWFPLSAVQAKVIVEAGLYLVIFFAVKGFVFFGKGERI